MIQRGGSWITGLAFLALLPGCSHLASLLPGNLSKDPCKNSSCRDPFVLDQSKQSQSGKTGTGPDNKSPWTDPVDQLPAVEGPLDKQTPAQIPDLEAQAYTLPKVPDSSALSNSTNKKNSIHTYPALGLDPANPWQAGAPSGTEKPAPFVQFGHIPLDVTSPPDLPVVEEKKEPLLVALDKFLRNQPEDAVELLKGYDETRQDVFLRLLPVLAQMTQKKLEDLGSDETSVLYQQLDGLLASLRSRTDLLIDRICFCEEITPLGVCKPMPEDYQFQARRGQQLGDLMRIYVQFRNLGSMKKGSVYQSQLSSSVEIVDERGERLWFKNCDEHEKPLCFPTPRHDPHTSYAVYVPAIPPGNYTLTLRVRDLTRPELNRTTQKSLPFRVRG